MRLSTRLGRLALVASFALPALGLAACDSNTDRPPRRAIVTAVQIDDGPLRDVNGNAWDGAGGGGPEIYFRLFYADTDFRTRPGDDVLNPRDDRFVVNTLDPAQPWVNDTEGIDFPLVWTVDGGFEVRDFQESYRVVLYDYDPTNEDDPMISTRTFTFAEAAPDIADGREDTIVLDGVGADETLVRVRLRVVYES